MTVVHPKIKARQQTILRDKLEAYQAECRAAQSAANVALLRLQALEGRTMDSAVIALREELERLLGFISRFYGFPEHFDITRLPNPDEVEVAAAKLHCVRLALERTQVDAQGTSSTVALRCPADCGPLR